ncbi:hypothetical protein ACFL6C_03595 [Myxococcota bacterium]
MAKINKIGSFLRTLSASQRHAELPHPKHPPIPLRMPWGPVEIATTDEVASHQRTHWTYQALADLRGPPSDPIDSLCLTKLVDAPREENSQVTDAAKAIADSLVQLDGKPTATCADNLRRMLPVKLGMMTSGQRLPQQQLDELLVLHADDIQVELGRLVRARRVEDVELLQQELRDSPRSSLEEIRRDLAVDSPHLTQAYVKTLCDEGELILDRDIDRMGKEPNLVFAAHVAAFMLTAPPGATCDWVVKEIGKVNSGVKLWWPDFNVKDLERLQACYHFVPEWPLGKIQPDSPRLDNLSKTLLDELEPLRRIPLYSWLMYKFEKTRAANRDALRDSLFVTTDHALNDKFDAFRHMILHGGIRGRDIRMVWKNYSADPTVVQVANRCFGIEGPVAHPDGEATASQKLEELTEQQVERAVEEAGDRSVFVHLQGVKRWSWLNDLAADHRQVKINAVSHTTSDFDEIRVQDTELDNLSLVVMADSPAKIRFERHMFSTSFERLLLQVEQAYDHEFQTPIRERRFLVYGGAGKIVGHAVVGALLRLGYKIAVVDPKLSTKEGREIRAELEEHNVDIIDNDQQLQKELEERQLFVINATAKDVFGKKEFEALGDDVITMNLGSGRKGFDHDALETLAYDEELRGPNSRPLFAQFGNLPSTVYRYGNLRGRTLNAFSMGDGYVFNLTTSHPNPTALSAFNNMLLIDSVYQSKHNREQGLMGPRTHSAVQVSFTWQEQRARPVIFTLPRDFETNLEWPHEWEVVSSTHFGYEAFPDAPFFYQDFSEWGYEEVLRTAQKDLEEPGYLERELKVRRNMNRMLRQAHMAALKAKKTDDPG